MDISLKQYWTNEKYWTHLLRSIFDIPETPFKGQSTTSIRPNVWFCLGFPEFSCVPICFEWPKSPPYTIRYYTMQHNNIQYYTILCIITYYTLLCITIRTQYIYIYRYTFKAELVWRRVKYWTFEPSPGHHSWTALKTSSRRCSPRTETEAGHDDLRENEAYYWITPNVFHMGSNGV